jgi:sulfur transfer protein SufE
MGLSDVVSVMRLRGMGAILARLKRQLAEKETGSTGSENGEGTRE